MISLTSWEGDMPWLDRGEACLHYALSGQGSRCLIFCHELGGSLESWAGVISSLGSEFRILSWDQRGAGRSEKSVQPYSIERHAEDLAALVEHVALPPPYLLVGAAAGAAIALLFAERHPQRIAGAVFCAPSLGVDPDRRDYLSERSVKAMQRGMRAIVEASFDRSYPPEARADVAAYQDYRARFLGNDPVSYGHANEALANFELGSLLAGAQFPVTLLAGRHDRLRPPSYVEELIRQNSAARFKLIDSGHIMPVQAPTAVADAIRELLVVLE
jgi:3-oxoadipate enol-lactonase